MGSPKASAPVKLVAGLLAASDALLEQAAAALSEPYGRIDSISAPLDWTVSTYYRAEMGPVIRRQFLSFEPLIAPDQLAAIKLATNALETRWRTPSGRQVNIDPGYIAATKLVLASTKDAAHRIYMGHGIYAEGTLLFSNGRFCTHAHTYPDYAAPDAVAFFNGVRRAYLGQLRLVESSGAQV
jgi:Domain of unknown function (DUF4416)